MRSTRQHRRALGALLSLAVVRIVGGIEGRRRELSPDATERNVGVSRVGAQRGACTNFLGRALARIRDGGLYRESHPTFEAYCRARWGMSVRHAERMLAGSNVCDQLVARGLPPPATESQARELSRLKSPEAQAAAWAAVIETHGEAVTARAVAGVFREGPASAVGP